MNFKEMPLALPRPVICKTVKMLLLPSVYFISVSLSLFFVPGFLFGHLTWKNSLLNFSINFTLSQMDTKNVRTLLDPDAREIIVKKYPHPFSVLGNC